MTDNELYHLLFNAVTDALEELEKLNIGKAKALLIAAQQKAEEGYLQREEDRA